MKKLSYFICAVMSLTLLMIFSPAHAATVFSDNFNAGVSPLWGNERGNWTTADGSYFAQIPDNIPPTFTSLPFNLVDFAVDFDLYGVSDGGIWLRCDFRNGKATGILLVTGGWQRTGTGLYWHVVHNDQYGPAVNEHAGLFNQHDNIHIRVVVSGNTYTAYLNGSEIPATTLVTDDFSNGNVGLYDYSSQRFDNLVVTAQQGDPDFDRDGDVDLTDFAILAEHWLQSDCDSSNIWCNQTDLDYSASTGLYDLLIFSLHWLETVEP